MEKIDKTSVEVKIKHGEPTPAQQAAWRELWAKLLQAEAEKASNEAKVAQDE